MRILIIKLEQKFNKIYGKLCAVLGPRYRVEQGSPAPGLWICVRGLLGTGPHSRR